MQFRIADTFTDSLARLTGDEQKAIKTAGSGAGVCRCSRARSSSTTCGRGIDREHVHPIRG